MSVTGHVCNAYCRGELHIDLVYARSSGVIARAWAELYPEIYIVGVVPAREAAPRELAGDHVVIAPCAPAEARAWLVWWR